MNHSIKGLYLLLAAFAVIFIVGCNSSNKPPEKDVVKDPAKLEERISENLKKVLEYALGNNGKVNDSISLHALQMINRIYENNNFQPLWSIKDQWQPVADSMYEFLSKMQNYGLFPSDYYVTALSGIRNQINIDSTSRQDAALWTKADVLLTESYLTIAKDLKLGRLERDSLTQRRDSLLNDDYFIEYFNKALSGKQIIQSLHELEPKVEGYAKIRSGIAGFLNSDSLLTKYYDSALYRFKRIALTLDRYKLLPDTMPSAYVLVNLPAFTLYAYDDDTLAFKSKVIVGSPKTRTPVLNSAITNFITYPQWTVPYSIIFKEMLPQIKKNINYLNKQNLMVVDKNDSVIDPSTIDWSKLGKHRFPYLLRQRQGDDNSLGVMKFNFKNKYSVYLHDTNARGLFSRSYRALSHGCVRVEKWQDMAHFLVRNDTVRYPIDTLKAWIQRQEKHTVSSFPRVPIYIRYFTVEGKDNGTLQFNGDIYKEDSVLTAKYFAGRKL